MTGCPKQNLHSVRLPHPIQRNFLIGPDSPDRAPGRNRIHSWKRCSSPGGVAAPVSAVHLVSQRRADFELALSSTGTKDHDGDALEYQWEVFGPAGALRVFEEASPVVKFGQPGAHVAKLAVTDSSGASDSKSVPVISGDEPPTVAVIGFKQLDLTGVKPVEVSASAMQQPGGPGGRRGGFNVPGIPVPLKDLPGKHDLYLVFKNDSAKEGASLMNLSSLKLSAEQPAAKDR